MGRMGAEGKKVRRFPRESEQPVLSERKAVFRHVSVLGVDRCGIRPLPLSGASLSIRTLVFTHG